MFGYIQYIHKTNDKQNKKTREVECAQVCVCIVYHQYINSDP